MKKSSLILLAILFTYCAYGQSQNQDCCNALVVCSGTTIHANPIGIGNNDFLNPGNHEGCLDSIEKNSVWFYFKIAQNTPILSPLGFTIIPDGGNDEDFDFALYGPNAKCGSLGDPLRCSFAEKFCTYCPKTGMWNKTYDVSEDKLGDGFVKDILVNPGDGYFLLVQNFAGSGLGFTLKFTEKAAAYLDCNIKLPCCLNIATEPNITVCAGVEPFQLKTSTSGGMPLNYKWEATGNGLDYLDDPKQANPWVTLPEKFSGSILYTVKAFDGNCYTTANVKVIVNKLTELTIDSIGKLCNSIDSVKLSGSPKSCQWSGVCNSQGFIYPKLLSPGKHPVKVSFKNEFGCVSEKSTEFEIVESTKPHIIKPDNICTNSPPVLLEAIPAGGKWSGEVKEKGLFIPPKNNGKFKAIYSYTNNDGCLGNDTMLIDVYPLPVVKISDPGMICSNESDFKLSAEPNGGNWEGTIDPSGMIHPNILSSGTNMVLYKYSSNEGCTNIDSMYIKLASSPDAKLQKVIHICNSEDTGKKTILNFEDLIINGETDGTWSSVGNSNGIGTFPDLDFKNVFPGEYKYTYTLKSVNLVCPDFTDTVSVIVDNCECPNIELTSPVVACNSEKLLDLNDFKISKEPGNWSIISTPSGNNPAVLNNSTLDIYNKNGGDYTINFKLIQNQVQGCAESANLNLSLNESPVAVLPQTLEVCNDHNSNYPNIIDLFGIISSGDKNGNWIDIDNSQAIGDFNELDFTKVKPGNYSFGYTTASAIAPCTEKSYSINIHVNDCSCPDLSLVPEKNLCKDEVNFDLQLLSLNNLAGNWAIIEKPNGSNPAQISNNSLSFKDADSGIYKIQFTPINGVPLGCAGSSTSVIKLLEPPHIGKALESLKICQGESNLIKLNDRIIDEDLNGSWLVSVKSPDPGKAFNPIDNTLNTSQLIPGNYEFIYKLTGDSPCKDATTSVNFVIESVPFIDAGKDEILDCLNSTAQLGKDIQLPPDYQIKWEGPGIKQGSVSQPVINIPGTYVALFSKSGFACLSKDSVNVAPQGKPIVGVELNIQDVSCAIAQNGKLEVLEVNGGTPDFDYSWNNADKSPQNYKDHLKPGYYSLELTDKMGCTYDTLIQVSIGNEISLTLGPDLFIDQNESFTLTPILNIPESQIASVIWSPDPCINCLQLNQNANITTLYKVQVIDENGCTAEDEVNVFVKKVRKIFIPNTFSPDGDGINDIFYINAGEGIAEITKMQIFDRWGSCVFNQERFQPNDPAYGWSGKSRNETLNTSVFVYWAEIKFTDGESIIYKGDVTLQK